jgi:hypothetical protein
MRAGIIAVGVIIALLGIIVLEIPLASIGSGTVSLGNGMDFETSNTYFSQSLTISWTATTAMVITIESCSSVNAATLNCSNPSSLQVMSGTSGTYTFTAGSAQYFLITGTGLGSAAISVKGTIPTLGLIFIILGAIIAVIGVALRSKKQTTPTYPTKT